MLLGKTQNNMNIPQLAKWQQNVIHA